MIRTTLVRALPLLVLGATACGDSDPIGPDPVNTGIAVPDAYVFDSRFEPGVSSVSYGGQTVRNLQVQDLKILIDGLGKPGAQPITTQILLDRYDYQDALDLSTLTGTGALTPEEARYSAIATGKSPKNAPIATAPVIGYDKTADQLMTEWFALIAANSQDPAKLGTPAVYTTAEGVDLSQMIEKTLHGAVAYSRGTGNYLVKVLEQQNTAAEQGAPYTKMEHYWDEAFGYFGAARDFGAYTDAQLAGGVKDFTRDSDGDGAIGFESEYNFAFAKSAGKRDVAVGEVDFSQRIFDAFLQGRTLIVNQGSAQEIAAQATIVSETWEEIIAANVIHYINEVLDDLPTLTAEEVAAKNNTDLNKHWAEMKGYAIGLQFNPAKQITTAQLEQFHALVGNVPPYAVPGTAEYDQAVADLTAAREILQLAYGFSDASVASW